MRHSGVQKRSLLRFCIFYKLLVESTLMDSSLVGAFGSQSPFEGHKASYSVSFVFPSIRLLESIAVVEITLKSFWKYITPIKTR